jgi:hypothetical protein
MPTRKSKGKTNHSNHTTKYANQHKLAIIKNDIQTHRPYAVINKDTLYQALNELQPAAFKVWTYLSAQKETGDRCTWDLSPQDIANVTGLSISGIHKCIKELEAKRYIINVEGKPRSKAFFTKQTNMPIFIEAKWE